MDHFLCTKPLLIYSPADFTLFSFLLVFGPSSPFSSVRPGTPTYCADLVNPGDVYLHLLDGLRNQTLWEGLSLFGNWLVHVGIGPLDLGRHLPWRGWFIGFIFSVLQKLETCEILFMLLGKFGDPSSVIAITPSLWWIHEVNLCDLESRSSWPRYNPKQLLHERCLHTKFREPSSYVMSSYCGNVVVMMKFTKLTSVTLKIYQGDCDTIPSRFAMRGTYTLNLLILAHLLLELPL